MEHTIMLIDDDLNIVKSLQRLLKSQTDYDVIALTDPEEMQAKIDELHPDLIIVDVMMPRIDGLEIVRQVKMNPATAHIKIITLSGNYPEDGQLILESMGVLKCMDKPFDTEEFIKTINDIVSGYINND